MENFFVQSIPGENNPAVAEGIKDYHAEKRESVLEKELTTEEKKSLSQMWVDLVVDCEKIPEGVENFSNEEMKEWMFQMLMHDTKRLLIEWDLESDEAKIKEIVLEDDVERKSQLEKEYILKMHDNLSKKIATFDETEKSSRWSSWPKTMRDQNLLNCVGASILGVEILENAEIEAYYANPVGHVVNLAKLSNGEWWYVDFRNGRTQCKKIDPQEISIADVPILKIDDPMIDYHLLPYGDNEEIIAFILSNLGNMQNEVDDDSIDEKNKHKIYAKKYLVENENKLMTEAQINDIFKKLFLHIDKLRDSESIQSERVRIRKLHGVEGESANDFLKSLTDQEEKEVLAELGEKIEMLKRLWGAGDVSFYDTASKNAAELIRRVSRMIEGAGERRKEGVIEEVLRKIQSYDRS